LITKNAAGKMENVQAVLVAKLVLAVLKLVLSRPLVGLI
jgi:hypothetical protein